MLAQKIGEFYDIFLQRVAAGRQWTTREVDAVVRGVCIQECAHSRYTSSIISVD